GGSIAHQCGGRSDRRHGADVRLGLPARGESFPEVGRDGAGLGHGRRAQAEALLGQRDPPLRSLRPAERGPLTCRPSRCRLIFGSIPWSPPFPIRGRAPRRSSSCTATPSSLSWYAWVPVLARRFKVVRPDMRGYGASTPMPRDFKWSLDVIIDDYARLMDSLGVQRFHLVGAKIGGIVARAFAARRPERVLTLTVVGSPPPLRRGAERIPQPHPAVAG